MARPKRRLEIEVMEAIPEAFTMPPCVQCARPMEVNSPERWDNEPGNQPRAWWNVMDFYCPHCHSFQNVGDDARSRYVKPSGKYLETGRTTVTVVVSPPALFQDTESAESQPMSD